MLILPVPERDDFWRVCLIKGMKVACQAKVANLQLASIGQQ